MIRPAFASSLLLATQALALPQAETAQQTSLDWAPCPDVEEALDAAFPGIPIPLPFDCASLEVPLDWTNANSEPLSLSLLRVNATKGPSLGSILYNPGGPGGPGIENLPFQSDDLMRSTGGRFDIVTWDPRGTGKTIPFDCKVAAATTGPSNGGPQRRDVPALSSINTTRVFLDYGFDSAVDYAEACFATNNETGRFLSTAFVARDMLAMVDALQEDGLLRYWGWSYGTVLGATFLSMFPDRVDRALLDSNINPHDYQAGHYDNYLVDTDKTMLLFLEECAQNADRCALAQYTNLTTAVDMLNVINVGLAAVGRNTTTEEGYMAYVGVKNSVYMPLYFPQLWPVLAQDIVNLLTGNVSSQLPDPSAPVPVPYNLGVDSINGIRSSDALWTAESPDDILDQVERQSNSSSSFADIGYFHTWVSAVWKMKAAEQYKGNFTAKTRFPPLIVNGAFDPATPLVAANNVSAGFEGSVVLQHGGYGHGLFIHPSNCTDDAVRAYFEEGKMPEVGTYCPPNVGAWDL